ncbi:aldehyde dehydrogenase family protein [Sphingobacterium oryzagri]|uniref:Aldehyde dehydrogenase n=1 Tax=Sphingobacterium oryzagri TaxID=3025669 RepID=A0ABY7WJC5_9SPHI|nr:aldehyde dehydrogenase family protein [Sphingobacterium sp. KACC 22765]WDF67484.1 aldehyde dehydrogenase family protein [Sphingobacterium sp. KACC 22765]
MNPYTVIHEIKRIYEAQVGSRAHYKQKDARWRQDILRKLAQEIDRNQDKVINALAKDFRKSAVEAEVTELMPVQMELKEAIRKLPQWMKDRSVKRSWKLFSIKPYLHYEPKGNSLIITPWNYPFQLPMSHLIASIAAGNTIMLKLSEFSPHINAVIRIIVQAVFEEEQVFIVEGAKEETTFLLGLRFDQIHFTGSPSVGKIVMQAAGKFLSDITLELGGKSPAIVGPKVHLQEVIRNIIWAKFVNAGQTCIAPDYLLIDIAYQDKVAQLFKTEIRRAFGDQPELSPDFARIINDKQFDRLVQALTEAVEEGATTWVGGDVRAEERFIAPTVITDLKPTTKLLQEEIFGPILPVVFYSSIEEALQIIQEKEKPLALYVFSRQQSFVDQVIKHTSSGSVCVNDAMVQVMHPYLPFGGVNNSGIGQSFGWYGFRAFSHERAVADVKLMPLSKFFWFPYTDKTKRMLRWFRRLMT